MAVSEAGAVILQGARAVPWKKPSETWSRRRSDAAMIYDRAARHVTILLCATCERKMPRTWGDRLGYRLLHHMHTQGHCDYCRTWESCNLFHHMEEGYYRQWEAQTRIVQAARDQQIAIRDKRRIRGLD